MNLNSFLKTAGGLVNWNRRDWEENYRKHCLLCVLRGREQRRKLTGARRHGWHAPQNGNLQLLCRLLRRRLTAAARHQCWPRGPGGSGTARDPSSHMQERRGTRDALGLAGHLHLQTGGKLESQCVKSKLNAFVKNVTMGSRLSLRLVAHLLPHGEEWSLMILGWLHMRKGVCPGDLLRDAQGMRPYAL